MRFLMLWASIIYFFLFKISVVGDNYHLLLRDVTPDVLGEIENCRIFMTKDKLYCYQQTYDKKLYVYNHVLNQLEASINVNRFRAVEDFIVHNNRIIFLTSEYDKKNKTFSANLIVYDYKSETHNIYTYPFYPQGIILNDKKIYILGNYKNKQIHLLNSNYSVISSFIKCEGRKEFKKRFQIPIFMDNVGNIFLGETTSFAIDIINKKKEKMLITLKNDNQLISIKKILNRKKFFRKKGVHSILVMNNMIYVSCFDHSQGKSKFWYDIISLDTHKLLKSVYTLFLYNFVKNGNSVYIYNGYGPFKLFRVISK